MLDLYRGEAAGYVIHRDSSRKEKVELRREPVYSWTNPIRGGEQDGEVFVWTCRGRAEVVATFFSYPATGPRNLNHELHSLSSSVLDVDARAGRTSGSPRRRGSSSSRSPTPRPPPDRRSSGSLRSASWPASSRRRASTSTASGGSYGSSPRPLYRYESTDPDVVEGAVFAFVTSAGTDPEVILVLEALRPSGQPSAAPAWQYGIARFSDLTLSGSSTGTRRSSRPRRSPGTAPEQDPKQADRTFRDRGIPPAEGTP